MDEKQNDTAEASYRTSKERRRCRREKMTERRNNKTMKLSKDSRFSIRNFRPVAGFGRTAKIYRCGSTDVLGARIRYNKILATNRALLKYEPSKADILVHRDAGLVIDLRSAPERKEEDAIVWMTRASGSSGAKSSRSERTRRIRVLSIPLWKEGDEASTATTGNHSNSIDSIFQGKEVENIRYVVRLDVLNRFELLNYARNEWLRKSSSSKMEDDHNQIMTELNKRGLAGLNEAILETPYGQKGMCVALKLVTLYREALARTLLRVNGRTDSMCQSNDCSSVRDTASIVFHCVQGKDRYVYFWISNKSRTGTLRLGVLFCPRYVVVAPFVSWLPTISHSMSFANSGFCLTFYNAITPREKYAELEC